ncbi:MAG: SlyX family protein [Alphaproteobacteria bacterium]|nr:MAG: SlyX family protein [Alphaproteobacteria bacterium]
MQGMQAHGRETAMSDDNTLASRLDEVEIRIAFQQETIDSLNAVVTKQWAELEHLKRILGVLKERVSELEEGGPDDVPNQRPPHY